MANAEGVRLQHVKPHGALYNMSVRRTDVAEAIARAGRVVRRALVMIGLPGSELLSAADAPRPSSGGRGIRRSFVRAGWHRSRRGNSPMRC